MIKKLIILFVFVSGFNFSFSQTRLNYSIQKEQTGTKGAVVSAHPLASIAGMEMLQKGGNAFDAAIATQLALAVVYPGAGNLGGGGFLVAHTSKGKNIAIDYREKAPAKAFRDMYLDKNGNPITNLSLEGALASGVPGTPAGLFATLKYAKLDFKTLIEPAIEYAEKGFAITKMQASSFNYNKNKFESLNKNSIAFVKSTPWKEGDILVQKELAETLKRLRDGGKSGFYEGKTADLIVAEMQRSGGIISYQDLKDYNAKERAAVEFDYKGYRIISMPLPSSGGIILEQMLKMILPFNIGSMGFQSASAVQLMIEVERRAFADRAEFLGDPDFVKVPIKTLVSDEYLNERMKDYQPGIAGKSDITKAGLIHESNETTHLSIVDHFGNAVAVTTTLNGSYGSKTVVSGAGFLLNNEMDDFSVKPGSPNMFGAVGNEKNAISPGKRMLSSMTPTIVLKNNKPFLVVGTPGGTTIPTSVFQSIVNIIDFNLSPSEAVNKPKFHHQWLPDNVMIESELNQQTQKDLIKMGYKLDTVSQIGRTELIQINFKKSCLFKKRKTSIIAIGDNRGDDDARAF